MDMILLNIIGLAVLGALVLRGALGFLEDWTTRGEPEDVE